MASPGPEHYYAKLNIRGDKSSICSVTSFGWEPRRFSHSPVVVFKRSTPAMDRAPWGTTRNTHSAGEHRYAMGLSHKNCTGNCHRDDYVIRAVERTYDVHPTALTLEMYLEFSRRGKCQRSDCRNLTNFPISDSRGKLHNFFPGNGRNCVSFPPIL